MKTINRKTLKSSIILAAVLFLQFNVSFATIANSEIPARSKEVIILGSTSTINVSKPVEATFEDFELEATILNLYSPKPSIPIVADFNDDVTMTEMKPVSMESFTPKEADFEDDTVTIIVNSIQDSTPYIQLEADFTDNI
ncbi:MAG: hypothetical protein ACOYNC_11965 [Bacteroidales bacterium]